MTTSILLPRRLILFRKKQQEFAKVLLYTDAMQYIGTYVGHVADMSSYPGTV